MEDDTTVDTYVRTPWIKRLPTVGTLTLGLVVAFLLRHTWWGLVGMVGMWIVCILVLHFVFRQPLERLLQYREYDQHFEHRMRRVR
jgi:hypothetical protein